jgi:hypothetical protein
VGAIERLSDEAILVRGGAMLRDDLARSAEANYRDRGEYALSFWSFAGMTASEIAVKVGTDDLPHSKLRASTVGRLRAAGFEVVSSEPPSGHVDVKLPGPVTDAIANDLDVGFDPPIVNPVRSHG